MVKGRYFFCGFNSYFTKIDLSVYHVIKSFEVMFEEYARYIFKPHGRENVAGILLSVVDDFIEPFGLECGSEMVNIYHGD